MLRQKKREREEVAVEKHDTFVYVNACFLRFAFEYVDMSIGAIAEGHTRGVHLPWYFYIAIAIRVSQPPRCVCCSFVSAGKMALCFFFLPGVFAKVTLI